MIYSYNAPVTTMKLHKNISPVLGYPKDTDQFQSQLRVNVKASSQQFLYLGENEIQMVSLQEANFPLGKHLLIAQQPIQKAKLHTADGFWFQMLKLLTQKFSFYNTRACEHSR